MVVQVLVCFGPVWIVKELVSDMRFLLPGPLVTAARWPARPSSTWKRLLRPPALLLPGEAAATPACWFSSL